MTYIAKHFRFIFFIIGGLFLFACSEQDNENYRIVSFSKDDLAPPVYLNATRYNFDQILQPRRLMSVGNRLVVTDKNPSAFIHVLAPLEQKYIVTLGKQGEGPGEIGAGGFLLRGVEPGTFWSHFANTKTLSMFSVNDTSRLAVRQVKQDENLLITTFVAWSSDTSLMAIRANFTEKFVEYGVKGNILRTYGEWSGMMENDEELPMNVIISLHQGKLMSSPDRRYFGFACIHRDLIETLDVTTGKITSIRGPVDEINSFDVDHGAGYPMLSLKGVVKHYYLDAYLGQETIYALYSGEEFVGQGTSTVFTFTYTGEMIQQYKLDTSISAMTVDEESGILYGISKDENPDIVSFRLKQLSKVSE